MTSAGHLQSSAAQLVLKPNRPRNRAGWFGLLASSNALRMHVSLQYFGFCFVFFQLGNPGCLDREGTGSQAGGWDGVGRAGAPWAARGDSTGDCPIPGPPSCPEPVVWEEDVRPSSGAACEQAVSQGVSLQHQQLEWFLSCISGAGG